MKMTWMALSLLGILCTTACDINQKKSIELMSGPHAEAVVQHNDELSSESLAHELTVVEDAGFVGTGSSSVVADKNAVSALEIEKILQSLEFCEVDQQTLALDPDCTAIRVIEELKDPKRYKMAKGVSFDDICQSQLNTQQLNVENPKLFAWLIEHDDSLPKLDAPTDKLIEMAKAAQTELVLAAAMRVLVKKSVYGTRSTSETIDFALSQVGHPHRVIRAAAATIAIGPMSRTRQDITDIAIQLLADKDDEISSDVCQRVGDLRNNKLVPAIAVILKDPKQREKHANCMRGLSKMWPYGPDALDPPSYRSDAAYKVSLQYLKSKPRNDDLPHWEAVADAASGGGHGHYKPELYIDAMIDIALDKDANPMARTHAIACVGNWGDKASFERVKKKLYAMKAEKLYLNAIENSEEEQIKSIERAYFDERNRP